MKKFFLSLLVLVLCFSVFAQGDKEGASEKQLPVVNWKISHTQAPNHFMNVALENMAKYVAEKSDNRFVIEIFHSGTLGSEQEVIENMQLGTIAGNIGAATLIANFVPSFNIFGLPGLFSDQQQFRDVMDSPEFFGRLAKDCESKGILLYGYHQSYFRQLYTKEPVVFPSDAKGMKIRVMGSELLVNTYQALGCNPTTTAWGELYSALQLGVCDGLDHVATSVRTMSFYKNLKYVCEPNLFVTPMFFIVSKAMYDKLPAEYKSIFDEAVEKVLNPELSEKGDALNEKDFEYLTSAGGLKYVECDVKAIHDAIAPVREKYLSTLEPWVQDIAKKIIQQN